jgi:hypothetical protein
VRLLWVHEGIFARTAVDMTWPEIMFYLQARSADNKKANNDRSQDLAERMAARAKETGRRGFSLEELM